MWKSLIDFEPLDEEIFIHVFSKLFFTELVDEDSPLVKKYEFERLEFLGDSILNTVITEKIFQDYPMADPGSLTCLRSRMVRNETLYQIVQKMDVIEKMKKFNMVNDFELDAAIITIKNSADLFESLIGTIYLDQGWDFAKHWIYNIYTKYNIQESLLMDDNYVNILQVVSKSNLPTFYVTITTDKKTKVSCSYNDKYYESIGQQKATTKQEVCHIILKDLIKEGIISKNIFDFKYK